MADVNDGAPGGPEGTTAHGAIPPEDRGPGYATGRATKQLIVEHAAQAFSQTGFYGTSVRGIARDAGVDHSLLLHHFGSKTELLLAVIAWYDERHDPADYPEVFSGKLPSLAAADAVFAAAVDGVVGTNASRPGVVRLFSVLSAEAGYEGHPARGALQRRHDALIAIFAGLIAQRDALHQADGGAAPVRTAEERAILFISVWEGLQVFDALHPGRIDLAEMLSAAGRTIVRD